MRTEKENREIRLSQYASDLETLKLAGKMLSRRLILTGPSSIIEAINERIKDVEFNMEEEREAIKSLSVS